VASHEPHTPALEEHAGWYSIGKESIPLMTENHLRQAGTYWGYVGKGKQEIRSYFL